MNERKPAIVRKGNSKAYAKIKQIASSLVGKAGSNYIDMNMNAMMSDFKYISSQAQKPQYKKHQRIAHRRSGAGKLKRAR